MVGNPMAAPAVRRATAARALVAGLALSAAHTGPAAAQSAPAAAQSVPADFVRNFFGAVHLDAAKMAWADSVGAAWGRLGVPWPRHEPEPDLYDFGSFDASMEAARARGVRMMPVLSQTAPWASSAPPNAGMRQRWPPADERAWREYVGRVVDRYPDVEYFEIWNEPNIDWFLRADENHRAYVDRILIPAAEEIHARGRKVVAPSYTLEWPSDTWPLRERPPGPAHGAEAVISDLDRWLSYRDAWRHVDVLSFHYSKGDVERAAGSLMPVYEHIYRAWIAPGRIEGIWNTEEGLTAEEAGTSGFVALEPWERPPYAQWVPRYTVPVLHWALGASWRERDQYKLFWYHMAFGTGRQGTLRPSNLLVEETGEIRPSETGRALGTLSTLLTEGRDTVGRFSGDARVGFGLFSEDTLALSYFAPYVFTSYTFALDDDLLLVAWLDLPGIELAREEATGTLEVEVRGLVPGGERSVSTVDYLTGARAPLGEVTSEPDGTLRARVPRTASPVLYLLIEG